MKHLVVWDGPVSESKLKNVKWSTPTDILNINHGVNPNYNCSKYWQLPQSDIPKCVGSNAFANLASQYPENGKLSAMLKSAGIDEDNYSQICLAGFSAAHGLNNPILKDSKSRGMISCFLAMDSYYGSSIKEGYLKFAKEASRSGSKAMFATTSPFGGPPSIPYAPSAEAIKPFLSKFDLENINFQLNGGIWQRDGNFLYGNYDGKTSHADHVGIGVNLIENYISPWMTQLDGNKPLYNQNLLKRGANWKTVATVGGVVLLVGGVSAGGVMFAKSKGLI